MLFTVAVSFLGGGGSGWNNAVTQYELIVKSPETEQSGTEEKERGDCHVWQLYLGYSGW